MEVNPDQAEQLFKMSFKEFNLYPRSLQGLKGYFKYLQYTDSGNRNLPFHFMVLTEKEDKEGIKFIKTFARYIEQIFHENRRIMSISEQELLNRQENVFSGLKDTDILVIHNCFPTEMSDEDRKIWLHLSDVFAQKPAIVKFLVAPRDLIFRRFRPEDHIFFRTFRKHLEAVNPGNEDSILFWLEKELSEEGYVLRDDFKTDIEAYVRTVYPKADLKERVFLTDLVERVEHQYFESNIEEHNKILTADHVPFYIKNPVTESETDTEAETKEAAAAQPESNNIADSKPDEQTAAAEYSLHFTDYDFSSVLDNHSNKEKNVLILSMSTLPRVDLKKGQKVRSTTYWAEIPEAEKADISDNNQKQSFAFFRGISQLEAGTKYWMTRLAAAGKHLDRIIICTTPETLEDIAEYDDKSAVKVYKEGILAFMKRMRNEDTVLSKIVHQRPHVNALGAKEARIVLTRTGQAFEDDSIQSALDQLDKIDTDSIDFFDSGKDSGRQREIEDTLFNIINKGDYPGDSMPEIRQMNQLYKQIRDVLSDDQDNRINLYLDAQGGQRTFFNLIFSLFSMQNRGIMEIKGVSAIDFEPRKTIHLIRDVTEEFQTVDLVSAVKAFSLYGRGDLLTSYYQKVNEAGNAGLINTIQTIADSISISNPSEFDEGVEQLKKELKDGTVESPYYFLEQEIQDKYRLLITGQKSVLKTVKWSIDNRFYQQALSFIEDKMPGYILKNYFHISIKNVSGKADHSWHRVDQMKEADPDYKKLYDTIQIITNDKKSYVSKEGKILYQGFSNLRGNMNQEYVNELCYEIMRMSMDDADVNTFIASVFRIDNDLKFETAKILLDLYLSSESKMTVGFLVNEAWRAGNKKNYFINKARKDKRVIDEAFIYDYEMEKSFSCVEERLFRKALYNIISEDGKEDSRDKKEIEAFKCIYEAFASILQSNTNSKMYFPDLKENMIPIMVRVVNSKDKKYTSLKQEIEKLSGSSGKDIGHICYGEYADRMQASYSWDDKILKDLKDRISESPDIQAYSQFHKIMKKMQSSESYFSGYGDYDVLAHLQNDFPRITHQAHHKYSVFGLAVDYGSLSEQQELKLIKRKAGLKAMRKDRNIIRMEFGPYFTDKLRKDEWRILCEIPAGKTGNVKKLDEFLGLHAALKQERNACNHASERGMRLSTKCIRNMLELYIQMADELEIMEP